MTNAEAVPAFPPFALANTGVRTLHAVSNDRAYRVSTWIPPQEAPPGGFPSIWVLDANGLFGTFVEAIRRSTVRPQATGIASAAVIGIAHDGDALFDGPGRQCDYTPGPPAFDEPSATGTHGGADAFLSFLADELAPVLHGEHALDPARRILFGHSLAGYLALHALATRPASFRTFAAISPSIWWDEARLRQHLARTKGGDADVFIGVGEREGESSVRDPAADAQAIRRRSERRMIANAQSFADTLRSFPGERRVAFHVFPDEDHASVLMIAIQRVLRFALATH